MRSAIRTQVHRSVLCLSPLIAVFPIWTTFDITSIVLPDDVVDRCGPDHLEVQQHAVHVPPHVAECPPILDPPSFTLAELALPIDVGAEQAAISIMRVAQRLSAAAQPVAAAANAAVLQELDKQPPIEHKRYYGGEVPIRDLFISRIDCNYV